MPSHAAAPSRRVTRGNVVTAVAILTVTAGVLVTALTSHNSVAAAGPRVPAAIASSSTSTSAQVPAAIAGSSTSPAVSTSAQISTAAAAAIALLQTGPSTAASPVAAVQETPAPAPAPAEQATSAADPTPVPAAQETPPADPPPADETHAAADSSAANWMEALIPEVDPGGEANWVLERKGGWGASDGHTNYIDPNVPSDKRFSVMVHELGHVKQVEVYGSLTASVAAMSAITGGGSSNVSANEKTADCIALMLGATWINYGCPDSLRGAASAVLAGRRA
jgi:hypothetical protein